MSQLRRGLVVVGLAGGIISGLFFSEQINSLPAVLGATISNQTILRMGEGERKHVFCDGKVDIDYPDREKYPNYLGINCLTLTGTPAPTPTNIPAPTSIPTTALNTTNTTPTTANHPTSPAQGGLRGAGEPANSFSLWTPSKWDTCTKAEHDSFFVIGPDGKKYPTWHPPTATQLGGQALQNLPEPGGTSCKFGHDHGRDPSKYQYWNEVKTHFAYDANKNGAIENAELASAGIPFGYVNEQIELTQAFMRHEDHVGHKIEYANGEGDIGEGTDPFDASLTGGVVVPVKSTTTGKKWDASGIRCYHFHKVHQGVSTFDAFTNNLHEVIMHTKCTSSRTDFPASTSLISGMIAFGAPGEFTRFCSDSRTQIIKIGVTDANKNFPGTTTSGMRNIITRDCVEKDVLVAAGKFSNFPYEIWEGNLAVRRADGSEIGRQSGGWEVLDAIRYYFPGNPNNLGYTAKWCYEKLTDGRQARGGACDQMTNYGKITDITYDDPRSGYRGLHRGQYVNPHRLFNAGGAKYWYTDSFGGKAQTTPFAGSIRQWLDPVAADTVGKLNTDPRIIQRNHDNGGNTVHAPN